MDWVVKGTFVGGVGTPVAVAEAMAEVISDSTAEAMALSAADSIAELTAEAKAVSMADSTALGAAVVTACLGIWVWGGCTEEREEKKEKEGFEGMHFASSGLKLRLCQKRLLGD